MCELSAPKWGVQLLGHPLDLADWEHELKQPLDPWVGRSKNDFVLRWSGFDGCETPSEVRDRAVFLVDQLNGVMALARQTNPIRFDAVVAFHSDGTRSNTTMSLGTGIYEARGSSVGRGKP